AHWQPILPISTLTAVDRPRVMAYVAKRDDFTVTLRSDIIQDLDIQVLEVQQHPHPPTLLVNVYNQPPIHDHHAAWTAERLRQVHLPPEVPTVISGDWNAHHRMWE
ncbi:hypothetical protein BKA93DRAFT_706866, partial [Sparassis latifolia]